MLEVVYACTHEGARHLDDVLRRQTRIAIQTPDYGQAASERVLALMQQALGWPRDVVEAERLQYQRLIAHQRHCLDPDRAAERDGSSNRYPHAATRSRRPHRRVHRSTM